MPSKRTGQCVTEGCDRDGFGGDQLCHSCRHRLTRYGDVHGRPVPRPPKDRRCEVDGCDEPHEARGKCRLHYQRERLGWAVPDEVADGRFVPKRVCVLDGCEQEAVNKRGHCQLHRSRWKDNPDDLGPVGPKPKGADPRPAIVRLMEKVALPSQLGGCWEWTGGTNGLGYGRIGVGSKRLGTRHLVYTHRASYEHFVGPIPEGYEIDHLCFNPPCCNPAHLEAVTRVENSRRSHRRRKAAARG